jgi:hypothetical protein
LKSSHLTKLLLLLFCFSEAALAEEQTKRKPAKGKDRDKKKSESSETRGACGLGTSDGQDYNQTHGISLKLGPPGAQNGHSNPLSIPPGIQDIEVTYVHRCGIEGSVGLVPGVTGGLRYRAGKFLYGSAGGGVLLTANGIGPGVYSAIGATLARTWPVAFEVEFKQAMGIGFDSSGTHLMFPYSFRIGAGVYW